MSALLRRMAAAAAPIAIALLAVAGCAGAAVGLVALAPLRQRRQRAASGEPRRRAPPGRVVLTVVGPKGTESSPWPAQGHAGRAPATAASRTASASSLRRRSTRRQAQRRGRLVGGIDPSNRVTLIGSDGYGMTFCYDQIMRNGFTTYDMATGAEEPPDGTLTAILAYAHDGKPLGADEGPLRLVVVQPQADQVIDGHWTVKWIARMRGRQGRGGWKCSSRAPSPPTRWPAYVNCCLAGLSRRRVGRPAGSALGGRAVVSRHRSGRRPQAARRRRLRCDLAKKGYAILIECADGKVVTMPSQLVAGQAGIILSPAS